jgi:glutaredoxin
MSGRIVVYTTSRCPRCKVLKEFLKSKGVEYEEKSLENPENVVDLRLSGVFVLEAPILQVGDKYLQPSELFDQGVVKEDILMEMLGE